MFTPNYTIEEKRVIVEEWMSSGITMKKFCRRKEINPSTFDGWLNRFYPDREKKFRSPQALRSRPVASWRSFVWKG